MISGHTDQFESWPEMRTDRLLDMYPDSELVKIYNMPQHSAERTKSWEALGVIDPAKQAACEIELENLINGLATKKNAIPTVDKPNLADLNFNFIWGK